MESSSDGERRDRGKRERRLGRGREREIDMERECVSLGCEIERGNKKETHRYKYRYYIVLDIQPKSILTWIYQAPKKRFEHGEIGSFSALYRSGLSWI